MRRGFSLVEFGIVLSVIAIMAVVTIGSVGYFRASRQRAAVDLVLTLRKAAVLYMQRHSRGVAFGVSTDLNDPRNVSMKSLRSEGFVPVNTTTPWGAILSDSAVSPTNQGSPVCAGFTCVLIRIPVPPEECADTIITDSLTGVAVEQGVRCTGAELQVTMR
ncbi:MAG: type II secretion system protein [Myxococcaceae bacterium]|nr:type II secretion system protein [Myxococcaceae bacterium]